MKGRFHQVGLTGGIGAGKSTVASALRQAGVPVINLDDLGRDLTDKDPELAKKINGLCGLEGTALDRRRVREIMFADEEVRATVEGVLHPLILKAFEAESTRLREAGEKLVVCEAALLVESGFHKALDELVVVAAPEPLRKERLIKRDSLSSELAERILRSQTDEDRKRRFAGYVIENDKDAAHLTRQVEALLDRWVNADWWKRKA